MKYQVQYLDNHRETHVITVEAKDGSAAAAAARKQAKVFKILAILRIM